MNFLYFLLPTLTYAFYNLPVHLYSQNIKGIDNGHLLCESNPDLLKKLILCQYIEKTNPNLSFIKMT